MPRQLTIVIGRNLFGSLLSHLFSIFGIMFVISQLSGTIPDSNIRFINNNKLI